MRERIFILKKANHSYIRVCGNSLIINRKGAKATKASLEKALTIKNPELKDLNNVGIKRANSYIYGIITDERIISI